MPPCSTRMRALLLLCAVTAAVAALSSEADIESHVDCLNSLYQFSPADEKRIFKDVMRNVLPTTFKVGRVFFSPSQNYLPVTVVTTATMDRLQALKVQCESWPGPLIAAVYTSFTQHDGTSLNGQNRELLMQLTNYFQDFVASITDPNACSLRLVHVWGVFSSPATTSIFPINLIRNAAISMVGMILLHPYAHCALYVAW